MSANKRPRRAEAGPDADLSAGTQSTNPRSSVNAGPRLPADLPAAARIALRDLGGSSRHGDETSHDAHLNSSKDNDSEKMNVGPIEFSARALARPADVREGLRLLRSYLAPHREPVDVVADESIGSEAPSSGFGSLKGYSFRFQEDVWTKKQAAFAAEILKLSPQLAELFALWDSAALASSGQGHSFSSKIATDAVEVLGFIIGIVGRNAVVEHSQFPTLASAIPTLLSRTLQPNFLKYLYAYVASEIPRVCTTALRLLTSLVLCGPRPARQVFSMINWTYAPLAALAERRTSGSAPRTGGTALAGGKGASGGDTRISFEQYPRAHFIQFALAFLRVGDVRLREDAMGIPCLFPTLFASLPRDITSSCHEVLYVWQRHILATKSLHISKTRAPMYPESLSHLSSSVCAQLFNGYALDHVARLLTAKLPRDSVAIPSLPVAGLRDHVRHFLFNVCSKLLPRAIAENSEHSRISSHTTEIADGFDHAEANVEMDENQGSDALSAQSVSLTGRDRFRHATMLRLLRSFKNIPTTDSVARDVVLYILHLVPELVVPYLGENNTNGSESDAPTSALVGLEPRLSLRWFANVAFVHRVLVTIPVVQPAHSDGAKLEQLVPVSVQRSYLLAGLGLTQQFTNQPMMCLATLNLAVAVCSRVGQYLGLEMPSYLNTNPATVNTMPVDKWSAMLFDLRKRLPDLHSIMSLFSRVSRASGEDLVLRATVRLLRWYAILFPGSIAESRLDLCRLICLLPTKNATGSEFIFSSASHIVLVEILSCVIDCSFTLHLAAPNSLFSWSSGKSHGDTPRRRAFQELVLLRESTEAGPLCSLVDRILFWSVRTSPCFGDDLKGDRAWRLVRSFLAPQTALFIYDTLGFPSLRPKKAVEEESTIWPTYSWPHPFLAAAQERLQLSGLDAADVHIEWFLALLVVEVAFGSEDPATAHHLLVEMLVSHPNSHILVSTHEFFRRLTTVGRSSGPNGSRPSSNLQHGSRSSTSVRHTAWQLILSSTSVLENENVVTNVFGQMCVDVWISHVLSRTLLTIEFGEDDIHSELGSDLLGQVLVDKPGWFFSAEVAAAILQCVLMLVSTPLSDGAMLFLSMLFDGLEMLIAFNNFSNSFTELVFGHPSLQVSFAEQLAVLEQVSEGKSVPSKSNSGIQAALIVDRVLRMVARVQADSARVFVNRLVTSVVRSLEQQNLRGERSNPVLLALIAFVDATTSPPLTCSWSGVIGALFSAFAYDTSKVVRRPLSNETAAFDSSCSDSLMSENGSIEPLPSAPSEFEDAIFCLLCTSQFPAPVFLVGVEEFQIILEALHSCCNDFQLMDDTGASASAVSLLAWHRRVQLLCRVLVDQLNATTESKAHCMVDCIGRWFVSLAVRLVDDFVPAHMIASRAAALFEEDQSLQVRLDAALEDSQLLIIQLLRIMISRSLFHRFFVCDVIVSFARNEGPLAIFNSGDRSWAICELYAVFKTAVSLPQTFNSLYDGSGHRQPWRYVVPWMMLFSDLVSFSQSSHVRADHVEDRALTRMIGMLLPLMVASVRSVDAISTEPLQSFIYTTSKFSDVELFDHLRLEQNAFVGFGMRKLFKLIIERGIFDSSMTIAFDHHAEGDPSVHAKALSKAQRQWKSLLAHICGTACPFCSDDRHSYFHLHALDSIAIDVWHWLAEKLCLQMRVPSASQSVKDPVTAIEPVQASVVPVLFVQPLTAVLRYVIGAGSHKVPATMLASQTQLLCSLITRHWAYFGPTLLEQPDDSSRDCVSAIADLARSIADFLEGSGEGRLRRLVDAAALLSILKAIFRAESAYRSAKTHFFWLDVLRHALRSVKIFYTAGEYPSQAKIDIFIELLAMGFFGSQDDPMGLRSVMQCNSDIVDILLRAYHATTARSDRLIFALLRSIDDDSDRFGASLSVGECAWIWGRSRCRVFNQASSSGQSAYSTRYGVTIGVLSAINDDEMFSRELLDRSVNGFDRSIPIDVDARSMIANDIHSETITQYDPSYVLPFLRAVVRNVRVSASSAQVQIDLRRWVDMGVIPYVFVGLTSFDSGIRVAAFSCLEEIRIIVEQGETPTYGLPAALPLRGRYQLELLFRVLRNSVSRIGGTNQDALLIPRLPKILGLFFARSLPILVNRPGHFLYRDINSFLLHSPFIDFQDVPMFYQLFLSGTAQASDRSSDNPGKEESSESVGRALRIATDRRKWILELIADSVVDLPALWKQNQEGKRRLPTADSVQVLRRRHVIELLLSHSSSHDWRVASPAPRYIRHLARTIVLPLCGAGAGVALLLKHAMIFPALNDEFKRAADALEPSTCEVIASCFTETAATLSQAAGIGVSRNQAAKQRDEFALEQVAVAICSSLRCLLRVFLQALGQHTSGFHVAAEHLIRGLIHLGSVSRLTSTQGVFPLLSLYEMQGLWTELGGTASCRIVLSTLAIQSKAQFLQLSDAAQLSDPVIAIASRVLHCSANEGHSVSMPQALSWFRAAISSRAGSQPLANYVEICEILLGQFTASLVGKARESSEVRREVILTLLALLLPCFSGPIDSTIRAMFSCALVPVARFLDDVERCHWLASCAESFVSCVAALVVENRSHEPKALPRREIVSLVASLASGAQNSDFNIREACAIALRQLSTVQRALSAQLPALRSLPDFVNDQLIRRSQFTRDLLMAHNSSVSACIFALRDCGG